MSLPGLELTQPSEERQYAVAPPSQIALNPGSEWRFEVAFGHIIRVKVCLPSQVVAMIKWHPAAVS